MKEFRIHGRGGQGSVVTAELFAIAAFMNKKYSQAFPYLGGGGERRGAPVQTFVRMDDKPITIRNMIHEPDYVIVKDLTLTRVVDVTEGLKKGGLIVVNTEKSPQELTFDSKYKVATVPATRIALEETGRPIMNTAIMGAFAAYSGEFSLESLIKAVQEKFPPEIAEKNIAAVKKAYQYAKEHLV
ncbi:MAG: pyruvate ferredoxin oxidoreductase subunit gamma [Christensenellales bacterium]